jgi:glycosyltransferase involved in cell wall biosynthesis
MNQTPAIPDISVITVVRNGMDTIAATLGSVEEQSHSGIEHLVIDGASSDGTLDLLAKRAHSRLRVYSASDRGIYDAMNTGAHLARGAWLVFINADDRLAGPNALAGAFSLQNPIPQRYTFSTTWQRRTV